MVEGNRNSCAALASEISEDLSAKEAKDLLQRKISAEYRAAQTLKIAEVTQRYDHTLLVTALIFRLGGEWLALPAAICQQILSPAASHWLPHRSNNTLLGIVNVRGQLLLKVSLLSTLNLTPINAEAGTVTDMSEQTFRGYRRMVVMKKTLEDGTTDVWAFDADELHGIHALTFKDLQPVAAGTNASASACTRYTFTWNNQQVSFLDDIKLFEALRQSAL